MTELIVISAKAQWHKLSVAFTINDAQESCD